MLTRRLDFAAQQENIKKFEVRDFLEEMVATGRERERLEELVDKFTKELDFHGAFKEDDFEWYFELMFEQATRDHVRNPLTRLSTRNPHGSPDQVSKQLASEERWIAEHFDYSSRLKNSQEAPTAFSSDLLAPPDEHLGGTENEEEDEDEDDGVILPVRDPNKKKFGKGGKLIKENTNGKKGKKKK